MVGCFKRINFFVVVCFNRINFFVRQSFRFPVINVTAITNSVLKYILKYIDWNTK